jgi:hypothetical protein
MRLTNALRILQLMPSPKWKLVVDIGEEEEVGEGSPSAFAFAAQLAELHTDVGLKDPADLNLLESLGSCTQTATLSTEPREGNDSRISDLISLIGEFMPSDPASPLAVYVPGFMSLRLLLLRQSRMVEEQELVNTILDSFSSYAAGGRERSEIAVMLARDFTYLSKQHHHSHQYVQHPGQGFLGLGSSMIGASTQGGSGLSLFGLPSTSSSLQNSPALTPIPIPGSIDAISIVSN